MQGCGEGPDPLGSQTCSLQTRLRFLLPVSVLHQWALGADRQAGLGPCGEHSRGPPGSVGRGICLGFAGEQRALGFVMQRGVWFRERSQGEGGQGLLRARSQGSDQGRAGRRLQGGCPPFTGSREAAALQKGALHFPKSGRGDGNATRFNTDPAAVKKPSPGGVNAGACGQSPSKELTQGRGARPGLQRGCRGLWPCQVPRHSTLEPLLSFCSYEPSPEGERRAVHAPRGPGEPGAPPPRGHACSPP